MKLERNRVCPVERAGSLDNRIRRWVQDPRKILAPYVKEGMTVLDLGCGPGFFSIDMAEMTGDAGRVIAVDLQEGMLQKLREKIHGTEFEQRITLHKCEKGRIGAPGKVDFVLAFYMLHEVPDKERLFEELSSTITHGRRMLIVEPPFHVSKRAFEETVKKAQACGFEPVERPGFFLSKAVVLQLK